MSPLCAHLLPQDLNLPIFLWLRAIVISVVIHKEHRLPAKIRLSFFSLVVNVNILPLLGREPSAFVFYRILALICLKRVLVDVNDHIALGAFYLAGLFSGSLSRGQFLLLGCRPYFQSVSLERVLDLTDDISILTQNRFVNIVVEIDVFGCWLVELQSINISQRHVALRNMIRKVGYIFDYVLPCLPLRLPHQLFFCWILNWLKVLVLIFLIYLGIVAERGNVWAYPIRYCVS